ncbi:MAG: hypothetical protein L6V93_15635 [Clostridiales bacterium]|nr:MAG: hypothetical protein L6V93_15635 [Clostridiales bacterium]
MNYFSEHKKAFYRSHYCGSGGSGSAGGFAFLRFRKENTAKAKTEMRFSRRAPIQKLKRTKNKTGGTDKNTDKNRRCKIGGKSA